MTTNNTETRAAAALEAGDVTRTPVSSMEAALDSVRRGTADAIAYREHKVFGITLVVEWATIRFEDRALGEASRKIVLENFGFEPTES